MKKALYISTGILLLLPLLAVMYLSVVGRWSGQDLLPSFFTFEHWKGLFSLQNNLGKSFLISLGISTTIASFSTVFGFIISRYLSELSKNKGLIQLAYFPYLIAPVVFGTMLQFYFNKVSLTGSIVGVLIAQVLFIFPYSVLLLATFWNTRIRSIGFQATTLGATSWEVFKIVWIPMARPWLFICFVQCFLISWYEYGITQLIGVGKVKTLTVQTMLFVKEANPFLAGLAACLMVLPVIFLLAANKQIFLKRTEAI